MQADEEEGKNSFIVALDKKTGKEVWRAPRKVQVSWATPLLVNTGKRTELITSGTESVIAYDPATGKELWRSQGSGEQRHPLARRDAGHDMVVVSAGFPAKVAFAIRLGASGELTGTPDIVWKYAKGTAYVPSPILYGDYLYLLTDKGIMTCLDARTGEVKYEGGRVARPRHLHRLARRLRRQDSADERGRRHLRHQGRAEARGRCARTRWASPSTPRPRSPTARSSSAARRTSTPSSRRRNKRTLQDASASGLMQRVMVQRVSLRRRRGRSVHARVAVDGQRALRSLQRLLRLCGENALGTVMFEPSESLSLKLGRAMVSDATEPVNKLAPWSRSLVRRPRLVCVYLLFGPRRRSDAAGTRGALRRTRTPPRRAAAAGRRPRRTRPRAPADRPAGGARRRRPPRQPRPGGDSRARRPRQPRPRRQRPPRRQPAGGRAAARRNYWTNFRGPSRDGRYDEQPVRTNWQPAGCRCSGSSLSGGGYASFSWPTASPTPSSSGAGRRSSPPTTSRRAASFGRTRWNAHLQPRRHRRRPALDADVARRTPLRARRARASCAASTRETGRAHLVEEHLEG